MRERPRTIRCGAVLHRPRPGSRPERAKGGEDWALFSAAVGRLLHRDLLHAHLGAVLLEGYGRQLQLDPVLESGRRDVATAATTDQGLELLLDAELAQARGAVLEVLGDLRAAGVVGLVIEELEHVYEH